MILRFLTATLALLLLSGCIDQSDAGVNQVLIFRTAQQLNTAHNRGMLDMDKVREFYAALEPYSTLGNKTLGADALGAFYATNLSFLDQTFINLDGDKAFLIIHTTVKTGEAFMEKETEQQQQVTLSSLKKIQQRLINRHETSTVKR